jgi:phosphoribosylformylglycinamidine cyclo-ligase
LARDLAEAGETAFCIGEIVPGQRGCTVFGGHETWSARSAWSATHDA